MNLKDYKKIMKPSKYRAVKTTVDGITFASKKEAARYVQLKFLEKHGKITELALQPSFSIEVNELGICRYRADFSYRYGDVLVVEDTKGFKTPVYKLKRKLMKAVLGIDISET